MTNRILKFRAWDTLAKHFIYPDKGYQGHFILTLNGQFQNLQNGSGGEEYIVQQFTGYTTIDGIEVYEGDLVSYEYGDKCFVHEVMWAWGAWHLGIGKDFHNYSSRNINRLGTAYYKCKIIGNILEHPELLNNEN